MIIPTLGHTSESVVVLLDTGEAIVDDLAMIPLCLRPSLPIFAEEVAQVQKSWEILLRRGAARISPAHEEPFDAQCLGAALS